MFKKAPIWIFLALLSVACAIFAFNTFSQAFPIVTLDLAMDRHGALQAARNLAQIYGWGPDQFKQAASFRLDRKVQNFVELEAGGNEAFASMIGEGLYAPYTWRVRHFREGETNETIIRFTPQGQPFGFIEKLPENKPGATLAGDSANVIAERTAVLNWGIDLDSYELVEESQERQPGGRTDHTFVYERPHVRMGEGRYRLRLVVGGDKLTELTHFIQIPEAFSRRYEEMRSANNTVASVSVIALGLIYVLGGCIIGLFFLLRRRWVVWRKPLLWGLFIAFLQVLAAVNEWPLAWMSYDTALSANGFLLQEVMKLIVNFLFLSALITLSLMAAESLSRKAFPHHLQQWRLWSRHVASSYAVLGRTVGGYLLVAVFWAFEVALYFLATRVLGWWTPSEALFQPDVLATYFPWLSSVAISAQAGFWEESLFRAVPIAGAALLGQKYGNRTAWIVAAFVLQALIFSAAHATYPAQPAYARLVELIIPSVGFGLIYLYFGLLPAIVLHFSMDVVAFALPLFISSAPGNWVNQLLVVLLLFVPLWVVLGARLRTKRWSEPAEEHYNRSWNPPQKERGETRVATTPQMADVGSRTVRIIPLAGLLSLTVWLVTTNFQSDAPPLTAGRQEVQELARHSLSLKGVELPETWKVLNHVEERVDQQHRFVWQEGGKQVYGALMRNYLTPPHWLVRFARFEGDVAERAEEFRVFVGGKKDVFRMSHQLPEAREGPGLLEENARSIAHTTLLGEYHVDPTTLKEVSAVESTLPKRRDWVFTFADTAYYPLEEGEARIVIKITGDKVADSYRYVHVPEDWARAERNRRNTTGIIALSSSAALIIALLAGIVGGIISWSSGSKQARRTPHQGKQFPVPVFVRFLVILFGLSVVNLINGWPAVAARFSTAEPISNQTFSAIGFSLTGSLFLSMGLALIIGFVQTWKNGSPEQRESTHGGISTPIVWGVSLGAMAAAVAALVSAFSPSVTPLWPRYSPAGSYLPLLATGLGPLARYIAYTTLLLLVFAAVNRVSENWRRRKGLTAGLLFVMGLVIAGAVSLESLSFWLVSGLVTGAVFLLAYIFVLRFRLSLLPLILGTLTILEEVKQGVYQAYPAALPGAFLAGVLVGLLSIYWFRRLETE